ncbi:MAG: radical SAM protein [Candidatus Lernaella stagnicola]|nr:radical SAM protein [Candidatus Lernaella stagnicola]
MTRKTATQHAAWRAAEIGEPLPQRGWGRAVAVYPGPYNLAMANLGYQWLMHALAKNGLAVARAVWPERGSSPETLRCIDDDRSAADADIWFVSVSFENDLVHLAAMLRLAGLPVRAAERRERDPLIVAGGVVPTMNPEPISELADVCLLGEGNAALAPFLEHWRDEAPRDRAAWLASLAHVPGAYVGRFYHSRYEGERLQALEAQAGFPAQVKVAREAAINPVENRTHLRAPGAVFGDSMLVEAARGCTNRCRFCAAGHVFLPYRPAAPPSEVPSLGENVLGLVGSNVSGHPDLAAWLEFAGDRRVALSSIRRDTLDEETWRALTARGLVSAAIAPEAGSEGLRRVINKPATDEEILVEVRRAIDAGVQNLKLYFMVGLPGESGDDVQSIVSLAQRCRDTAMDGWKKKGWAGRITLSVNPFVPKPHTPFQWHPFGAESELKKKLRMIAQELRRTPNLEMQSESLRAAVLQALLSVGDRRAGELARLVDAEGSIRPALRAWQPNHQSLLAAAFQFDDALPWDAVDMGIRRSYLEQEYQEALAGRTTPPCRPESGCRICGICG